MGKLIFISYLNTRAFYWRMSTNNPVSGHTFVIKAICLMGFINASQMTALINAPMVKQVSSILPAYFMISVALSLICLVGLWLYKKWAAIAYSILLILNQGALILTGFWEMTALILPAVIIGLLFYLREEMA